MPRTNDDRVEGTRTTTLAGNARITLDHPRVLAALRTYRESLEAGRHPSRQQLLNQFPEIAGELAACLDGLEFVHTVAPNLRASPDESSEGAHDLHPTAALGDFRIQREIGRGGMGIVYEAEQLSLGRRVALKVLPFAAMMDSKQLQRFRNEAHAAAQLHHQNIVPVYFVGSERGVHYYAMQYIEGHTLAEVIRELQTAAGNRESGVGNRKNVDESASCPIPESRIPTPAAVTPAVAALSTERSTKPREFYRTVARLGIQAAEALDHAHQVGIIHRDIKPSNLLLETNSPPSTRDGRGAGGDMLRLWITDFGLARTAADSNLTMTGDLVGTLRYMSPEQALAKRVVVDHRTDIYSLGVTLYELLTLQPAFAGEDRHELLRQIAFDEPEPPSKTNTSIPVELETIVLKAMATNPSERYATAQELADDLRQHLEDKPIRARRPGPLQRVTKWSRRHRSSVWCAATCSCAAIIALVGSIGFVKGDRNARIAAVGRLLELPLHEAERLIHEQNCQEARPWLERAEGLIEAGGSCDEARSRVLSLRSGLYLVQQLEEARLERAAVLDRCLSYSDLDARFEYVFRDHGLELESLAIDDAAERIHHSAVGSQLIAMIDAWVSVRRRARGTDDTSFKTLLSVARVADSNELRNRLRVAWEHKEKEVLQVTAASVDLRELPASTIVLLSDGLADSGDSDEAISVLRTASLLHPGDFWIVYGLVFLLHESETLLHESNLAARRGNEFVAASRALIALRPQSELAACYYADALRYNGDLQEAAAALREGIRRSPGYAHFHTLFGLLLAEMRDLDGAIEEFRAAIRLDPLNATAHDNLAAELAKNGDLAGSIAEDRKAIELQPDHPRARYNLGITLKARGQVVEAEEQLREAIRTHPIHAEAHCNLGLVLAEKGDREAAILEYRRAIELKPHLAEAHNNLGLALLESDLDTAIAEFRRAIELKPDFVHRAHYKLAYALEMKGELNAAIAEYDRAIELKPDYPEAHCNLGLCLRDTGRFSEALAETRKGHDLGSCTPGWPYPSGLWVLECERLVVLDGRLDTMLRGEARPKDAAETIEFALLCLRYKHRNMCAARLFMEAFAAEPELRNDMNDQHRYNAACAAALAGCGQGEDAASLDDAERSRLRHQAIEWLHADLALWKEQLANGKPDSRATTLRALQHWLRDTDLSGVRDMEALAKLAEAEREAWFRLWAEVAEVLRNAAGQ